MLQYDAKTRILNMLADMIESENKEINIAVCHWIDLGQFYIADPTWPRYDEEYLQKVIGYNLIKEQINDDDQSNKYDLVFMLGDHDDPRYDPDSYVTRILVFGKLESMITDESVFARYRHHIMADNGASLDDDFWTIRQWERVMSEKLDDILGYTPYGTWGKSAPSNPDTAAKILLDDLDMVIWDGAIDPDYAHVWDEIIDLTLLDYGHTGWIMYAVSELDDADRYSILESVLYHELTYNDHVESLDYLRHDLESWQIEILDDLALITDQSEDDLFYGLRYDVVLSSGYIPNERYISQDRLDRVFWQYVSRIVDQSVEDLFDYLDQIVIPKIVDDLNLSQDEITLWTFGCNPYNALITILDHGFTHVDLDADELDDLLDNGHDNGLESVIWLLDRFESLMADRGFSIVYTDYCDIMIIPDRCLKDDCM